MQVSRHSGRALVWGLSALTLASLVGCLSADLEPAQIRTLSNRADLVSGGDALVEISFPAGASAGSLRITVDGRDVTSSFSAGSDGRYLGLLTGLAVGANTVVVENNSTATTSLVITNAPRHGPVMAGPLVTPFYCATTIPQAVNGNVPASNASGLAGAPDANCNIAGEVKLYYRTTTAGCTFGIPDPSPSVAATATAPATSATPPANACFKPYTVGTAPSDMASTTTDAGVTMPYIVRVERGTMNRGIYDIAVLVDPARAWTATAPQAGWNRKVVFNFGASTGQPRRQARPATAWSGSDNALSRGVMVVANSMTDSARNSNRVLMSETVMMMKEHIIDSYGPIRFTMGSGCSGGAIN
ncbi:MAG: DUF6351 family protein, partial [Rubrivivax sp.]|nr:DUF6351 family protein [Rubrivivax sp.]